jgi:hypothetical protein
MAEMHQVRSAVKKQNSIIIIKKEKEAERKARMKR